MNALQEAQHREHNKVGEINKEMSYLNFPIGPPNLYINFTINIFLNMQRKGYWGEGVNIFLNE